MKTKSIFSLGVIPVIFAALFLTIATNMDANAQQNTTQQGAQQPPNQTADPQQIKNYLNSAIQALDGGNNTQASQQFELADEQMEMLTGTTAGEHDDGEGIEEGAGEDADEQGDVDVNDKEDLM